MVDQTDNAITSKQSKNNCGKSSRGFGGEAFHIALDDVHTRFLLNLPSEELASPERIFFQLEQAYWFYDDFYCDKNEKSSDDEQQELPRFKSLFHFCQTLFRISPLLSHQTDNFTSMWNEFTKYKRSISTYGTILLNEDCTKVLMCQDFFGKSWTFPAGKVNQKETGIIAGARETYEETGFDINCQLGLTRTFQKEDITWKPLDSNDALFYTEEGTKKRRTCYVCRGVPEDFPFEPVARKEVADIQWFNLSNLPKKTFAALPFIGKLRKWIRKNGFNANTPVRDRSRNGNNRDSSRGNATDSKNGGSRGRGSRGRSGSVVDSRENKNNTNSTKKNKKNKDRSRNNSRAKVREGDPITQSCLANVGDNDGWTEEEMFSANEKLLGREVTYDGNPHTFAQTMVDLDPHKFHVVGGSFMNSTGEGYSSSPEKHNLQPLVNLSSFNPDPNNNNSKDGSDSERDLQPFFSDGKTPWGEFVEDLAIEDIPKPYSQSNKEGLELLNMLQKPSPQKKNGSSSKDKEGITIIPSYNHHAEDIFLTDAEITKRSQQDKIHKILSKSKDERTGKDDDWEYLLQWVKQLSRPPPTPHFGEIKFNIDLIMDAFDKRVQMTS